MRQVFLQKILDKQDDSDCDEDASSTASNIKPKNDLYQDSQDPYDL